MPVDQQKLEQFMQKFVGDLGASLSAALILLGDELGLYKAMAKNPTPGIMSRTT